MKIRIPTKLTTQVGERTSYADDYVFNDGRPNKYGDIATKPIYETRVVSKVVFDRDLKIVQRLTALGQLVLWISGILPAITLICVGLVSRTLYRLTVKSLNALASLMDRAGVERCGLFGTVQHLAARIVGK